MTAGFLLRKDSNSSFWDLALGVPGILSATFHGLKLSQPTQLHGEDPRDEGGVKECGTPS